MLVGCGKMGGALLHGWLAGGCIERAVIVEPAQVPDQTGLPKTQIVDGRDSVPPDFKPEIVVFAIKPQMMDATAPAYADLVANGAVVMSIAAGKSIASFQQYFGAAAEVVRAMPNLPASVGRGITVAVGNDRLTERSREQCSTLLSAVGQVEWIADETLLDAVTALSGSGPAYIFLLIEAMTSAGINAGLPEDLASRLARATVSGSGELARLSSETAADLRRNVTSPKGTTAAALDILMAPDGMQQLFNRAIAAAADRSRELAS